MILNSDLINGNCFNNGQNIIVFDDYKIAPSKKLKLYINSNKKSINLKEKHLLKNNEFFLGGGVLLKYNNEYLFGRRDFNTPIEPDKYTFFSGHCSENPSHTQEKEFCEELLIIGQNKEKKEKRIIDIYHDNYVKKLYRDNLFDLIDKKFTKLIESVKPIYPKFYPDYEIIKMQEENIYNVYVYIDNRLTMDLGKHIVSIKNNKENCITLYRAKEIKLNKKHEITDMFFLESENEKIETFSMEYIKKNKEKFSKPVHFILNL